MNGRTLRKWYYLCACALEVCDIVEVKNVLRNQLSTSWDTLLAVLNNFTHLKCAPLNLKIS